MSRKLTDHKWLNLFETEKPGGGQYLFASRKENPDCDRCEDAVVIVPYRRIEDGLSLIVTKEFRPAIGAYEYGFPAGIIDKNESLYDAARRELFEETGLNVDKLLLVSPQIYSSAGMTDESISMIFVTVVGEITNEHTEEGEIIEVMELSPGKTGQLIYSGLRIGAKAWPVMDHFARTGKLWTEA